MDLHGGNIYSYKNCLDFSVNLNPLGPPESVKKAILRSLNHISEYPQIGYALLRQQIAKEEQVEADSVIVGNGAAELIYAVCQAVRPKRALLAVPTFSEYARALTGVGCDISRQVLQKKEDYRLTEAFLVTLKDMIKDGKKPEILFLCNPNNPTGRLISPVLLQKLCRICEEEAIYLVLDECFLDFVDHPKAHTLVLKLIDYPHLLLLKAFTKCYAIPGVRLGYGLSANQSLLFQMQQVLQPWNLSCMAVEAGLAALKEKEYLKAGRRVVQTEREYLMSRMSGLGIRVFLSDTNYLLFEEKEDLFSYCIRKGFLIRDCANFEGLEKGSYRIAVKTREENEKWIQLLENRMEERMLREDV